LVKLSNLNRVPLRIIQSQPALPTEINDIVKQIHEVFVFCRTEKETIEKLEHFINESSSQGLQSVCPLYTSTLIDRVNEY